MNNDEIAKHTGAPIERVNQIEAEEFDRISKSIAPCNVFVEAADHERINREREQYYIRECERLANERDDLAAQLASITSALRNYEMNGSDAVKQIEGIYADGDAASALHRERARQLASATRLKEHEQNLKWILSQSDEDLASIRDQLATVTKERDAERLDKQTAIDLLNERGDKLTAANERAEKAEGEAMSLFERIYKAVPMMDGCQGALSRLRSLIDERDALILQLQQEKERADKWEERWNAVNDMMVSAVQRGDSLRAELLQCQSACVKKDEALKFAAETFTKYAAIHNAKGTPDGINKGSVNRLCALRMESALYTPPATALDEALEKIGKSAYRECYFKYVSQVEE